MCDSGPKRPAATSLRARVAKARVALWASGTAMNALSLFAFAATASHLFRVDAHRFLHQEGDSPDRAGHGRWRPILRCRPSARTKSGAGRRKHVAAIREGRGLPTSAARSATMPGSGNSLDGDELHVRHGDEVAEVGGVVKRMPVADFDGGNPNRHRRPLGGCAALYPASKAMPHVSSAAIQTRSRLIHPRRRNPTPIQL